MNNIEQNALRIAELKYPLIKGNCPEIHKQNLFGISKRYKTYNHLMPLVFECNRSSINPNVSIHINDVQVWIMQDDEYVINPLNYVTETEFIQAIQECVIKYLELKNE